MIVSRQRQYNSLISYIIFQIDIYRPLRFSKYFYSVSKEPWYILAFFCCIPEYRIKFIWYIQYEQDSVDVEEAYTMPEERTEKVQK